MPPTTKAHRLQVAVSGLFVVARIAVTLYGASAEHRQAQLPVGGVTNGGELEESFERFQAIIAEHMHSFESTPAADNGDKDLLAASSATALTATSKHGL